MHKDTTITDAINAVTEAQRFIEIAQVNPISYTETQNKLNYAELLLIDVQIDPGNIEDRHQLQQAIDLIQILKETHNN